MGELGGQAHLPSGAEGFNGLRESQARLLSVAGTLRRSPARPSHQRRHFSEQPNGDGRSEILVPRHWKRDVYAPAGRSSRELLRGRTETAKVHHENICQRVHPQHIECTDDPEARTEPFARSRPIEGSPVHVQLEPAGERRQRVPQEESDGNVRVAVRVPEEPESSVRWIQLGLLGTDVGGQNSRQRDSDDQEHRGAAQEGAFRPSVRVRREGEDVLPSGEFLAQLRIDFN